METKCSDVITVAARLMEQAEKLGPLQRNLQMSAIHEYVDQAAADLKTFRPQVVQDIAALSDYAGVLGSRAGLGQSLGKAQASGTDAAKSLALSLFKNPAVATLTGSGPVAIFLKWTGVLEAIGKSVGELAGAFVAGFGLLSGGVLLWAVRAIWTGANEAASAAGSSLTSLAEAPNFVKGNLVELEQVLGKYMSGFQRAAGRPPIFDRARNALVLVALAAVASLVVAIPAAYTGLQDGYKQACDLLPNSKTC